MVISEKMDEGWYTPFELNIEVTRTAYLSMDLSISAIEGERANLSGLGHHAKKQNVLRNCHKCLQASRAAGIHVVHTRVAFRLGYPEFGKACSPFWSKVRGSGAYIEGTPETEICEEVRARECEPVVMKSTVDPFVYSDLDKMLRVRGIHCLILTGVATSNAIEGTVRAASDRGYLPVVLEDCVADYNEEMHRFQILRLLPMHAIISDSGHYVKSLARG